MTRKKKICIAFLGNALHDSRITNLTNSLKEDGCRVSVIGFDWFISSKDHSDEDSKIFKINKGRISLLFYLNFAFILIRELIFTKADIYFAEDIYTLPFVTLIARARKSKIYYNSRELYPFIGGLRNRPRIQKLVTSVERYFIKKVDIVLTTGKMDSSFLEDFYGINNTLVIRNIPLYQKPDNKVDFRRLYNIPNDRLILLYQGVMLEGRGIPLILIAMSKLPRTCLVLLGDGEQKRNFQHMASELNVADRVIFAGTILQKDLINYTAAADIGLSIIENISISYYHALPNKLFEYIMAGLPVLSSDLPQMKEIVDTYKVGEYVSLENEESIVPILNKWIDEPQLLIDFKNNCQSAALELNWQKEYESVRTRLLELA
jgi:glycosyltransferase involved in cell wall biosynthesis